MQTRAEKIKKGKVWQVSEVAEDGLEKVIFEGFSRSACISYLRKNNLLRFWKSGKSNLSLGQLIFEN